MARKKKITRTWFFGWTNIRWFIKEIGNIYSSKRSYFSKKRLESGISFGVGQIGMIWYICENVSNMSSSDIALWAGIEFAIAGYIVNQIQREKNAFVDNDEDLDENQNQ